MTIQIVRLVVQEAGGLPRHEYALVETSRRFDNGNLDRLRCLDHLRDILSYVELKPLFDILAEIARRRSVRHTEGTLRKTPGATMAEQQQHLQALSEQYQKLEGGQWFL